MTYLAKRLLPGQDLKQSLLQWCTQESVDAACIVTCVGSLTQANLRFADQKEGALITGSMEIVSLVGTLSRGGGHLHISLSDANGRVVGGHVLDGCLIHTTAEVILARLPGLTFKREFDPATGYGELAIAPQDGVSKEYL